MKIREWEVDTVDRANNYGTFTFVAETKELAHAHALQLRSDEAVGFKVLVSDNLNEKIRGLSVRFIGWKEV